MMCSVNCVSQELFAQCGADKADDALWLKLAEIHFPHNALTELDASLVSCPVLFC